MFNKIINIFKKKECEGQITKGMTVDEVKKSTFSGVLFPQKRHFKDINIRRKRYERFKNKFAHYDSLTIEEKEQMRQDAIEETIHRRALIKEEWIQYTENPHKYHKDQMNPCNSTCHPYTPTNPDNTYVIPDCYYGCGNAPCVCTEDYEEYQRLKIEFEK